MKPKIIVGVFAIVGFTSLLMYNFGNSISTYVNFEQAQGMESAHVVGSWDKSKEAVFNKQLKQFHFYMKDQSGNVRRVIYPKPKPNNFDHAKQLVVIGHMKDGTFYANDMLMKCPSKYNDADPSKFTEAKTS